jgi:hypothetical protein
MVQWIDSKCILRVLTTPSSAITPCGFAWGIKSKKKKKMLSCPGLFKWAGLEVENSSKKVKPHD